MRKIVFLSLLCFALAVPSFSQAAKQEVFEFSFQSLLPDSHVGNAFFLKWGEEIAQKSNGRLKMNLFTNASITRYDKVITGVEGGVVDIGMASVTFNQATYPYAQSLALPFLARDAEHATKVLWELWDQSPEFRAEFSETEMLTMWCVDRSVLMSTKSLIKKPSDLKGKRVLIGSGMQSDEVGNWGGNSVVIAMSDSYVGLQRGMGEVLYGQLTAVAPYKLYEIAKYLTVLPSCLSPLYIMISKDFMDELPPDLQGIIRETTGESMGLALGKLYKDSGDADALMMENQGVTIYTPTEADMEEFKRLSVEVVVPMWKKVFADGGVKDVDAWVEKVYAVADSVE